MHPRVSVKSDFTGVGLRRLLAFVIALICPTFADAAATSDAWIDHASTVAQVFHDTRGSDVIDTDARRAAAFDVLISAIQEWEGALDWRNMSSRAAVMQRRYYGAVVKAPFGLKFDDKTCKGHACVRWRYFTGRMGYASSIDFTREVLGRYFAPEYVAAEINWKIAAHRGTPTPSQSPGPADPNSSVTPAAEDTSKAFQESRTALFLWEARMPTVAQVNADTVKWDSREQAINREAAFSALLDKVYSYELAEGSFYVAPPPVKEKLNAYAKAIGDTYKSACPPVTCTQGILQEEEQLRYDPDFKHHIAALYFGNLRERVFARAGLYAGPFITIGKLALPIGLVVFFGWLAFRRRAWVDPAPPLTQNFGSASFAPFEPWPRTVDCTAHGVFLGKSSGPGRRDSLLTSTGGAPMVTTHEHHTLIVARTRSGKGTRVIVPTLLRYTGNMFVIDPKGENTAITARTRRDTVKQTVHVLNPWGVMAKLYEGYGFEPATYNPLDILDRNDPNAVSTARRLANAICPVTGRGDDAFWQNSAANILAAVFLWLADQPGETKTLARAREIVTLDRKTFTDQFVTRMAASTAFDNAIAEMMRRYLDFADDTYSGITSNLQTATDFISDQQLKKATNSSTFSMADLRDRATTIYLIPPDEIETQRTWLRLMIAAATHSFRRPVSQTPARRSMMLIDEFPALGKLQDLPTDIATMAGYGLDFTLVVQGIDQLKATYDKDSGTILNNCAYKWYCNITDLEGAKHVSESLGEATVRTVGKGTSSGVGGGRATEGESTTYGEKGRMLFTPDEIINLGRDVAIAFQPEGWPMYLTPIDYWDLMMAFAHLHNEPRYAALYWNPPLTYDENPQFKKEPPPGGSEQKSEEHKSEGGERSRPPPRAKAGMSEKEAREILGVAANATADAIRAAYKRLMLKVHPDTGGSTYFARQLNEARTVLLGK